MKRLLLLLGVAALFAAAPASAQYIYLDVNGDGVCDMSDVLGPTVNHIDVYLDSSHDQNGDPVACSSGTNPDIDFLSYEFILRSSGGGSVTWGAYTENAGFTIAVIGPASAGTDFWVGWASQTPLPASGNPYKLGSVAVTITGNPVVGFAMTTPAEINAFTVFGSNCFNPVDFDPTWVWGTSYWPLLTGACGTAPTTPSNQTTWGAIKNLYK